MARAGYDYDVVVVGSGFGGSVTALRLAEKGYRVGVLEAGRRFADHEFAKNSWHLRDFLWAPALGCYGILRMTLLRNAFVLSGAGVGGGSLVYANLTDWKAELAPYYDQARRMLGVTTNPATTASDRVLREVARELGVGHTYRRTPVGVLFGTTPDGAADPDGDVAPERLPGGEEVPDPFFGGAGPARRTCTHCGERMTGCRHGAKNTTVKNYLHLAERAGAVVHPLTTVRTVAPIDPADPGRGYRVETVRSGPAAPRRRRTFTAEQVVFSAAALGTQRLLHRMRDEGHLPRISARLGELSRTNSEAINGPRARCDAIDFSRGVAIADKIDGIPMGSVTDLVNRPVTAHFIGGCPIGESARTGVVDPYQRLFGHPGLHVVDGAAVSANLGVNPSLTIAAQAERAMALWPNAGDGDLRPDLGTAYRRLDPVPPRRPAVPEHAPAALRLPWPAVRTPADLPDRPDRPGR